MQTTADLEKRIATSAQKLRDVAGLGSSTHSARGDAVLAVQRAAIAFVADLARAQLHLANMGDDDSRSISPDNIAKMEPLVLATPELGCLAQAQRDKPARLPPADGRPHGERVAGARQTLRRSSDLRSRVYLETSVGDGDASWRAECADRRRMVDGDLEREALAFAHAHDAEIVAARRDVGTKTDRLLASLMAPLERAENATRELLADRRVDEGKPAPADTIADQVKRLRHEAENGEPLSRFEAWFLETFDRTGKPPDMRTATRIYKGAKLDPATLPEWPHLTVVYDADKGDHREIRYTYDANKVESLWCQVAVPMAPFDVVRRTEGRAPGQQPPSSAEEIAGSTSFGKNARSDLDLRKNHQDDLNRIAGALGWVVGLTVTPESVMQRARQVGDEHKRSGMEVARLQAENVSNVDRMTRELQSLGRMIRVPVETRALIDAEEVRRVFGRDLTDKQVAELVAIAATPRATLTTQPSIPTPACDGPLEVELDNARRIMFDRARQLMRAHEERFRTNKSNPAAIEACRSADRELQRQACVFVATLWRVCSPELVTSATVRAALIDAGFPASASENTRRVEQAAGKINPDVASVIEAIGRGIK